MSSTERFTVNIPEQETCSVCLETLHGATTIIIEPCKHMIHLACLDLQRKCPLCRTELPNPLSYRDNRVGNMGNRVGNIDNRVGNMDNRVGNRVNMDRVNREILNNYLEQIDNIRIIENISNKAIHSLKWTSFVPDHNSKIVFGSDIWNYRINSNQFLSGIFNGAYKFFIDMQQGERYFDLEELFKIGYGDRRRTGKKSIAMFQEKFDQLNSNAKISVINTMKIHLKPNDTKDRILELFVTESDKLSQDDNTKKEKGLQLANEFANALFP